MVTDHTLAYGGSRARCLRPDARAGLGGDHHDRDRERRRAHAEEWARAIFDPRTVPPWVGALFAVRQTAVKALGIPRGGRWMLAVSRATSDEAIIDTDDRHLRFVAAVTAEPHLVHVTTAVTLKGWRGGSTSPRCACCTTR